MILLPKIVLPVYLSGVNYLRSFFNFFFVFFSIFCSKKLEVKDHKGTGVVGVLWEWCCRGVEVCQGSSLLFFIWVIFFSVVLCRCLRAIRSSALTSSAILQVGHLWNRRGRGGRARTGKRKISHQNVTQIIINPRMCTETQTHTHTEFTMRQRTTEDPCFGPEPP